MREMKVSGVDWIGYLPSTWQCLTIGNLFRVRNEKVNDTDYPPLSVTKRGIIPQMENVAKSDANDNRKKVIVNDFVINSRSDRKQSCGVSGLTGSVSLINTVLYTANDSLIIPEYMNYLLKNYGFAEEFYRWGHGIVADLWTTRWQEMKSILLPIPSKEEQKKILNTIELKRKSIDSLISNVQSQIEKLKAYKQSLITEVVTKGLDPNVEMKGSGVEWIGDLPKHYKYIKSFYVCEKIGDIDHYMPQSVAEGYPYVMTGDLKSLVSNIDFKLCKKISLNDFSKLSKKIIPEKGDVIFARYATIGNVCYVDVNIEFLVSYSCVTIKPKKNVIVGKYLWYYYQSNTFMEEVKFFINANTQGNVGVDALNKTKLIVPPLNEQIKNIQFLDIKCSQIEQLISIKQLKIAKLEQYKRSIIYEYVTGKKEVS